MTIKVGVLDTSVGLTGSLVAISRNAYLLRGDVDYTLLCRSELPSGDCAPFGNVVRIPFRELRKNVWVVLSYPVRLVVSGLKVLSTARRHELQVLHVNDFYNLSACAARLFGYSGAIVVHIRFMPQRFPRWLGMLWIRLHRMCGAEFVCVSQAVRVCFAPRERISVISDPLPPDRPDLRRSTSPDGVVRLLYVGNYIEGKGQDLALRAFDAAYRNNRNLTLRFVGGDLGMEKNRRFRESLTAVAHAAGLMNVVTFAGDTIDVAAELVNADIALNFSKSESFSLTCLEALFYGTPLIATDSGGPRELFEHEKSGILVPTGDVDAMSRAILRLARDATLRRQLSMAGSTYVRTKFSADRTSGRLLALYRSVLDGSPARAD